MNPHEIMETARSALSLPEIELVENTDQLPPGNDGRWRICLFEQHGCVRIYLDVPDGQHPAAAEFVAKALAAAGLRVVPAERPNDHDALGVNVLLKGTGQIIQGRDPEVGRSELAR